jgi:hypothetical protein
MFGHAAPAASKCCNYELDKLSWINTLGASAVQQKKRKRAEWFNARLREPSLSATRILSRDRDAQGFAFSFSILDTMCFAPIWLAAK